jgi:hypothetical protein
MQSERVALDHDDFVLCYPTDYYFHVAEVKVHDRMSQIFETR